MHQIRLIAIICLIISLLAACTSNNQMEERSGKGLYSVLDYGADPSGKKRCTKAIQKALDAATANGGGRVVVPAGTYLTGTIFIKDNTTLEIAEGAEIKGSPNIEDYTPMTQGHNKDRQPYHLIMAKNAKNIKLCGKGTINGNGEAFWKSDPDTIAYPRWIMAKDKKVSPMVEIQGCQNVSIKDLTFTNPAGWTLHPYDCDRVSIDGIVIDNNVFAPNADGIDVTGCYDVTISNCKIRTCDDGICVKTTNDSRPSARILVTNCSVETLCAALKIGNETYHEIEQVTFSNCIVHNSSRAIAIYAEGGAPVRDITFNNIVADTKSPLVLNRPIHLSLIDYLPNHNLHKDGSKKSEEELNTQLENIKITNFICESEGRILITANADKKIRNLIMRDLTLRYPYIEDPRVYAKDTKSSQFSPKNLEAQEALAALVAENVDGFVLDNLVTQWPKVDTVPEDWNFARRISNGTLTVYDTKYQQARQTELGALWLKGIQNGRISVPYAQPSADKRPFKTVVNSDIKWLD